MMNLALAFMLALDLFAERNNYPTVKKWMMRMVALAFCVLIFFLLDPIHRIADMFRIVLLAFAFHLLVAFSPFTGSDNTQGFWQFNKILFLRFLTSALYSAVLFAGLAIALVAIDGLFAADIRWSTYMIVFAIITAGFNTIFFLSGLPTDIPGLNEDHSYPKGLKIFTQFVLIPLMTIYLAILLVYEIKIIILWQLPKGLVSSLVLGYAVFGILSLLLIYPIKDTAGNGWIKLFSKFFYVMLIPLIILLTLAVSKRVGHYGITESRYIIIVLALWLAAITIYFLFSKKQNIKTIPVSLCLIALLATYGPQSAFSVSKYSQLNRLERMLKSKKPEDLKERPSVIRYLIQAHGLAILQPFVKKDLSEIERKIELKNDYVYKQREDKIDTAMALLKIKDEGETARKSISFTLVNDENEILKVKGYDYAIEMNTYPQPKNFVVNGHKIETNSNNAGNKLTLSVDAIEVLYIDVNKIFKEAIPAFKRDSLKATKNKQEFYYPGKLMQFSKTLAGYEYTVVITSLQQTYYPDDDTEIARNWGDSKSYLLIKKL